LVIFSECCLKKRGARLFVKKNLCKSTLKLSAVAILLGLYGCTAEQTVKTEVPVEVVAEQKPKRFMPPVQMDENLLYTYLAGEIAAQRGELQFAYDHYLQAARSSGDAYAAKRAAQIGLYLKQDARALLATNLWLSYEPDSLQARNTAAVLSMREGYDAEALAHLRQMHKIAEKEDKDGFTIAALSLAKEADQQAALKLMRAFVAGYPDSYLAMNALGVLQAAFNAYQPAVESLQKSLQLNPDAIEPKVLIVRLFIEQDKSDEAIAYIESILDQHADNFDLGLIYAKLLVPVDHRRSYDAFRELNKLQPQNAEVLSALGILAVQLDDIAAARDWWKQVLSGNDRDRRGDAAYQLGQLAELAGDLDEAVSYYTLVNHGSYRLDARLRLARINADRGDISKARGLLQQLRVLQPEKQIDYLIVEGQLLQDKLTQTEVLDFYAQALTIKPDDIELIYARGLYASDQGLIEQAEADFRRVIELEPENADALNALGYTLTDQTDRHAEALKLIEKAIALKPESAAILDSMGWVLYRLGDFEQSLAYLQRAYEKSQDAEIASHLGELLWVTGNQGQAREIWDKALAENPHSKKVIEARQRLEK